MFKPQLGKSGNEKFVARIKRLKKRLEDIRSAEKLAAEEFGMEDESDISARLFIVIKNGFDLGKVSNLLAVKPDFAWKEGENFEMWGGIHKRPDTVWGIESVTPQSSLEEHLNSILSRLDHSEDGMNHFLEDEGFDVYIRLNIDMHADLSRIMVLSATLERLSSISNYVIFIK